MDEGFWGFGGGNSRSGRGIARKVFDISRRDNLAGGDVAQGEIDIADQVIACGVVLAVDRQPLLRGIDR